MNPPDRTLVFAHANGFPAGTYRQLFDAWRAAVYLLRRAANLPIRETAARAGVSLGRVSQIQRAVEDAGGLAAAFPWAKSLGRLLAG